ncbi:hypothetical protein ACWDVV_43025, partial [Streptomyces tendae]
ALTVIAIPFVLIVVLAVVLATTGPDDGAPSTERIYPGARHEVFNETNRAEVFADVTRFLDGVLAR